jgi:hypothetical protein
MAVVRLILLLTLLATIVLVLAFLVTRDKRYIALLKKMFKFLLSFFALLAVFYLITRVLHL